jgi:hypothetical protein
MKIILIMLGVIAALLGLWFLDELIGIVNPLMVIGFLSALMYFLTWVSIRLIIELKKLPFPRISFGSFKTHTARIVYLKDLTKFFRKGG